jgi:predicted nucleotidyltransferase
MCHSASSCFAVPARVRAYVGSIVETCAHKGQPLVSVVLFGSGAIGGWVETVSDVDILLVVPDTATGEDIERLHREVERVETLHGLRAESADEQSSLKKFVDKLTAHDRTFFICKRGDLLSGKIGQILRLHPLQSLLVDRIVLASLIASGVTVWGETVLPLVPAPPIRGFDVFKSLFCLLQMVLLSAEIFPLLPGMTRYAMGALKSSVHSCFYCYRLRRAPLAEEISFFERHLGPIPVLSELLDLRRDYRDSFRFIARCIPTMVRLHLRTFVDNRFSRKADSGIQPPQPRG